MDYTEAALEFLAKEENLPIALEVTGLVEQLKQKLHKEFWSALYDKLEDTLANSQWANAWTIEMPEDDELLSNNAKCSLVPSPDSRGRHYLGVVLEQGTRVDSYSLYYGIHWNESPGERSNTEQVTALADELQRQRYRPSGSWLGYKYLGHRVEANDTMLRMVTDRQEFVAEIVQKIWALFEEKQDQIWAITRTFASVDGSGS